MKTSVGEEQVNYLYEHQAEFPGVEIAQIYLRDYEYNTLAAQILGHVGEISPEELKRLRREGYRAGDRIGKAGIEAAFDAYLRGEDGRAQIRVDSLGNQVSDIELRREPRAGYALRLTLDIRLQRAAEEALRYGIDLAHQNDNWAANGGAIVALDPRDGAVLAMASSPTYKPSVYVGRVDPKKLEPLLFEEAAARANSPGLNRATRRSLPARLDLEAGHRARRHAGARLLGLRVAAVLTRRVLRARPSAVPELEPLRRPADDARRGARRVLRHVLLRDRRSLLPAREGRTDAHAAVGSPLRLRRCRPGSTSEARRRGLLPTPDWRWKTFESDWDRAWNPGDSIQLSIGQKDLLVTPLQMAAFYAMLANGGDVVTPYLVSDVEQPGAKGSPRVVLRRFAPQPAAAPESTRARSAQSVTASTWRRIRRAGRPRASSPTTSCRSRARREPPRRSCSFPAIRATISRTSPGGAGGGPSDDAKIVVCALIENGGHGSTAAAPAALRVFEKFFGEKAPSTVLRETD